MYRVRGVSLKMGSAEYMVDGAKGGGTLSCPEGPALVCPIIPGKQRLEGEKTLSQNQWHWWDRYWWTVCSGAAQGRRETCLKK